MNNGDKKKHYWCNDCQIPLIKEVCHKCVDIGHEIASDLKPVFKQEYDYYKEIAIEKLDISNNFFPKVLYRHNNRLISDISNGSTHFRIKIVQNNSFDEKNLMDAGEYDITFDPVISPKRSDIKNYFLDDNRYIERLIKGNLKYLEEIENEAINFIKAINEKFSDYYKITSFSGGKDSTVTAFLVNKAIGKIPVVFSDTGIEYPETINYINQHGNDFGILNFLKSETDFMKMCEELGPPSRIMRWCCFTNKGAPLSKFYANLGHKRVLSFDGIRKNESNLRSNYPREKYNTKYEKQHSAYPILNWTTLEVWLYIIWRRLPYNNLYNHGFSRIGCWACPNNNQFDWFLFSKVYPNMIKEWFALINTYKHQQIDTIRRDDDLGKVKTAYDFSWVEEGAWKARRVKYHNEENLLKIESPCGKHDFDLYLKNPINKRLKEFFKVFGNPNPTRLPNNQNLFRFNKNGLNISYLENKNHIKLYIDNESNSKQLKKLVFRQINKSENCINCGACGGSCPQGAITINPHFHINEEKCNNCLTCTGTKYLKMSCVALHYKENRLLINLKNL